MGSSESKIWVFVEHRQGQLIEVGLELVQKALDLGRQAKWKVAAVLVGHHVSALAEEILTYGVNEVLMADDPLLKDYCNQAYAKTLATAVRHNQPEIFLLGATAMGMDLGPRLAAKLRTGLSAHCIDLELTDAGELLAVVPGWGGSIMAKISCLRTRPQMATVKPGVFDLPQSGQPRGRIITLDPVVDTKDITYRIVEVEREEVQQSDLDTAEVVVAGGWGVGAAENWKLIQDLASVLGGAVGATRPAVDEGWAEEKQMIGTSGRTVKPKLYIGVALSGHMHHMVGIKNPDLMVGINQDRTAPIFTHCDIGLVGDFKEILPKLITAIKPFFDR
ncbi:MAG: electron transfer flavoprotein subunit alpha/FixB family protein [Deltaproteobacteria bacterium]|nr:electron transfer flavoprotein subunit alpha/FixB family protein [Deltaproteobacteria bacterium]MBW2085696.1 electron transfer flavoprotein subunit alpha/FixB family protein [Deltaproteobacteria bacterium]